MWIRLLFPWLNTNEVVDWNAQATLNENYTHLSPGITTQSGGLIPLHERGMRHKLSISHLLQSICPMKGMVVKACIIYIYIYILFLKNDNKNLKVQKTI